MCVATLKSMTIALKAKKILNNAFIECEIIKLEANLTKRGCGYGIKFDCINYYSVEKILNDNKVKYNQILNL